MDIVVADLSAAMAVPSGGTHLDMLCTRLVPLRLATPTRPSAPISTSCLRLLAWRHFGADRRITPGTSIRTARQPGPSAKPENKAKRACRPDSVHRLPDVAAIPLGRALPQRLVATYPQARAGRAFTRPESPASPAYLVLLRVEVAAFHVHAACAALARLCGPVRRVTAHGR